MAQRPYNVSDPHSKSPDSILDALEGSKDRGLTGGEAERRLDKVGVNRLEKQEKRGVVSILLRQFRSVVLWVLVAALLLALVLAHWPEAIAIAAVILVNTMIGFFAEWKATRTIDALQKKEEAHVEVLRDGEWETVLIRHLVPGDLIRLKGGDLVPADARLLECKKLRVNEAALTGESEPVTKTTDVVDAEAALAERYCMLYKGCSVMDGTGRAIVTATGMQTELGQIAKSAMEEESSEVPLRARLDRLGHRFIILVLVSMILVALTGWWQGRELVDIIEVSVALGIAAVPEGLPVVATIALAHGMWLMGKRNAVVKQLQAVQALGSVPYLFVDKTGTLTRNRMQLIKVVTPEGEYAMEDEELSDDSPRHMLEIGVLCNGAELGDSKEASESGDPMEIALLEAWQSCEMDRKQVLEEMKEVKVVEFDREHMMMATFNQSSEDRDNLQISVKGAPERVLDACDSVWRGDGAESLSDTLREEWSERTQTLAGEGYRVLGAAFKTVETEDAEPYEKLTWLGLFALEDPPRENVSESIDACEAAGIKVIMVTGDKPETAEAIARQSGIGEEGEDLKLLSGQDLKEMDPTKESADQEVLKADVIARVEPRQKMELVKQAQAKRVAVGMTGDGVNDAPALKRANIGIAMGERGTEAAKQVADIVLRDDALDTIVEAVRRGRTIMDNIRKAAIFFLCTNFAEIVAVTIGTAMAYPLPLLALQILYLNVITDVFPALALSVGPADQNVMQREKSQETSAILERGHWLAVGLLGLLLAGTTLSALVLAKEWLGLSDLAATTVSFLTLGMSKVWFPFNLRDRASPMFKNEVTRNPWVWGAVALCLGLLLLAVYFRPLGQVLETAAIPLDAWMLVLGLSLVPLVCSQIGLEVLKRH